jgi:formate hydrogenlyase subunit 3/multisubunit Na+/H+ antiporter MnhD subunit
MFPIASAIILQLLCGILALAFRKNARIASAMGVTGAVVAGLIEIIISVQVLAGKAIAPINISWHIPFGAFQIGLDGLSAAFMIPIGGLCALSAVYGSEYLKAYAEHKPLGNSWFLFNVLAASMAIIVSARHALLFLIAWEIMSLSSFFLVAFESEKKEVREASWIYLIAAHVSAVFITATFLFLGRQAGGFDFSLFSAASIAPSLASLCFILALIGFGAKAGILPFHVWLPEAHPAAPSHVSALMSGVMIKTGIYGILRIIVFLGVPPIWWGVLLIAIGLLSGLFGVLFALAQHDLKKLLAYHSVENIGIIMMGIGLGVVGLSLHSVPLAALGFAGGLLHVINHAVFKGLLFMGAGSVAHGAHTREIDHLGGLIKKMPWTAVTFLIGAIAISGLPPLNGFVSEFLIYFGSFTGASSVPTGIAAVLLAVIAGLALIGGLAVACFTKAFGIVFLGEPRSEHPKHARESGKGMLYPMALLAIACLAIGLLGFRIIPFFDSALAVLLTPMGKSPAIAAAIHAETMQAAASLRLFSFGALAILVFIAIIAFIRIKLLSGRTIGKAGTWDCGYAQPTARMQYTASSFAQPIVDFFNVFHHGRKRFKPPQGYFPASASFETRTLDTSQEKMYKPLFEIVGRTLSKLTVMQHGRIQLYVLYIVLTLAFLLIWKLR